LSLYLLKQDAVLSAVGSSKWTSFGCETDSGSEDCVTLTGIDIKWSSRNLIYIFILIFSVSPGFGLIRLGFYSCNSYSIWDNNLVVQFNSIDNCYSGISKTSLQGPLKRKKQYKCKRRDVGMIV